MYSVKIIALSLLLVACGSKGDSDDSGSSSDGFAPQAGTWTITPGASEDGCGIGIFDDDEDAGEAVLTMDSDGTSFAFLPEDDDGDEPISCTLDGQDFTCPVDMGDDGETDMDDMDATILNSGSMGGSFSNVTTGEIEMEITVDCEGADCGDLAEAFGVTEFPCSASQTYGMAAE